MSELLTPDDIENLARRSGLTIAEVCRRADVAQSTFSRWKSGQTEPTLGVYRRIARAAAGEAVSPAIQSLPATGVEAA